MATMNISLPDQMKRWVEECVQSGRYANASDYVRDLIRQDPVNDASHGHNYYLESPEYIDDFYQRLRTEPTIENRRLYRESYQKGIWNWILWDDEDSPRDD